MEDNTIIIGDEVRYINQVEDYVNYNKFKGGKQAKKISRKSPNEIIIESRGDKLLLKTFEKSMENITKNIKNYSGLILPSVNFYPVIDEEISSNVEKAKKIERNYAIQAKEMTENYL